MKLKMYFKIICKNTKKHPFINVLITAQMAAVFIIGIVMTSAVSKKMSEYKAVESLIDNGGLYCGGYFIEDEDSGTLFQDTGKLKENLKNVDSISTINFYSMPLGVDSKTNEVKTAYTLIYDDYSSKLYTPETESGTWITESDNSETDAQAVITKNYRGYETGDVVTFEGDDRSVRVKIIGVIGDNVPYIASNTKNDSLEPSYNSMLSKHFNCLNDELKNEGLSDEKISENLEALGYSGDETVYNEPVLFFLDAEWKKTGLESIMSDSLFIKYNDNITDNEKLYNGKYIKENLSVLSFASQFSQIKENSLNIVYKDLYSLLPIMTAIFLLVLVGSVSVNAINFKNNERKYSVLMLCGARKNELLHISGIYNCLVCITALIISAISAIIFENIKTSTVIIFGSYQLKICLIVFLIYMIISCAIPTIMIRNESLTEMLKNTEG